MPHKTVKVQGPSEFLPPETHDPKSFFSSDYDGLACAIRDLHKFLAANLGAVTKRDLERGLNKMKDEILQEIKGHMATLKEQLDAQEAQLTAIANDVDGIVASVNGINADVQALKKQIDDLNASPGELTPENQDALNRIQALAGTIAGKTAAAKTAAAELDAATANGSGDGGQTPPTP